MEQNNAQSMLEPKIYYGFTPHVEPDGIYKVGNNYHFAPSSARACVAVIVGQDSIKYGVSVCSETDNFCREKGRELALKSLNEGFGEMKINPYYAAMVSDHKRALFFLNTKVRNIFANIPAFQRKMELVRKDKLRVGVTNAVI